MKYKITSTLLMAILFVSHNIYAQTTGEGVEIKMEYRVQNCTNTATFSPNLNTVTTVKGTATNPFTNTPTLTPIKIREKIYTVDLYVKHTSNLVSKYLGHSSIYFQYDPSVLQFRRYKSENLDENTYCTIPQDTPYEAHAIDGSVSGHFLMTMRLKQPTIIPNQVYACQRINDWILVGSVSFKVLNSLKNPNLTLMGTPSGYPTDTRGINFSDDTNHNKYEQFFIDNPSKSFNQLCPNTTFTGFTLGGGKTIEEELSTQNQIKVYPNPFESTIQVLYTASKKDIITIMLYNEQGQKVRELIKNQTISAGAQTWDFDLQNLADGIYYIQTQTSHDIQNTKIIKIGK